MSDVQRRPAGFRFTDDLMGRLRTAAAERGVTMQWLSERLLEEGLESLIPSSEFRMTRERDTHSVA